MQKAPSKKRNPRLAPLDKQLAQDRLASNRPKDRGKGKRREDARMKDDRQFVDAKQTERILDQARSQIEEEEALERADRVYEEEHQDRGAILDDSDELPEPDEEIPDAYYDELEIDPEDEAAIEAFRAEAAKFNTNPTRNLADIVMAAIREKETEHGAPLMMENIESRFDPRVVSVYRNVGVILSRYHSGKIPKPFKVIPGLNNWEEVLFLTKPESWTPAATYQATRIFASSLSPVMAQRFYNLVLLPNIRENISRSLNKKLNAHLFNALKKSFFKPSAFFRGILLPLAEGGDCTLREAAVICAAMAKMSLPPIHSSAAMLKLCAIPYYSGPTSLFLRVLINKKYALAFRVIDAIVNHFLSFELEERKLPVLWHQALLTFVQRYKQDITTEQKQAFKPLLRAQMHHLITPEIRRELFQSSSRNQNPSLGRNYESVAAMEVE